MLDVGSLRCFIITWRFGRILLQEDGLDECAQNRGRGICPKHGLKMNRAEQTFTPQRSSIPRKWHSQTPATNRPTRKDPELHPQWHLKESARPDSNLMSSHRAHLYRAARVYVHYLSASAIGRQPKSPLKRDLPRKSRSRLFSLLSIKLALTPSISSGKSGPTLLGSHALSFCTAKHEPMTDITDQPADVYRRVFGLPSSALIYI